MKTAGSVPAIVSGRSDRAPLIRHVLSYLVELLHRFLAKCLDIRVSGPRSLNVSGPTSTRPVQTILLLSRRLKVSGPAEIVEEALLFVVALILTGWACRFLVLDLLVGLLALAPLGVRRIFVLRRASQLQSGELQAKLLMSYQVHIKVWRGQLEDEISVDH